MLNELFTGTPKPSKHARAKLAMETGLSMRVIQVIYKLFIKIFFITLNLQI